MTRTGFITDIVMKPSETFQAPFGHFLYAPRSAAFRNASFLQREYLVTIGSGLDAAGSIGVCSKRVL